MCEEDVGDKRLPCGFRIIIRHVGPVASDQIHIFGDGAIVAEYRNGEAVSGYE